MELCDGDLSDCLSQCTKLDSCNALVLADNLARGYRVLQTHKIVHRDIKPQVFSLNYENMNQN